MRKSEETHLAHCAAFAALILGVCPLAPAQTPKPSAQDQPIYRTRTQEVIVDVVVGSDGKPAPSRLSEKDFSIFEDGRPQKITFFERHGAKTLPPGAAEPLPAMPPNVYTNVPQVPESDAVDILLLDSLNTDVQDQMYVRNEATAFLAAMTPGTEIAMFSLDMKLDLVQPFTTDPGKLLTALGAGAIELSPATPTHAAGPQPENGGKDPAEKKSRGSASTATAWSYPGNAYVFLQHHPDIRARMTLEALDYLGRYLAAVPGRKNLIWISDEFPVTIFPSLSQRQDMEDKPDIANHARRTADMLTRARVAVYPIQAEGMMNDKLGQASNPLPGMARRPSPAAGSQSDAPQGGESRVPMGNAVMSELNNEAGQRADKIYSMEQLASDTGGKAFYNSNDLNAALARAIRDGSDYYTLVYTPTNSKLDGSYRRIKVKLTNGKYKLSYRQGYNADSLTDSISTPDSDPLHPVMRLGLPQSTEILYAIRILPAAQQPAPAAKLAGSNAKLTGPVTRYSVDFMIRWTDLRLEPGPQHSHTGKIEVQLLAYSPDGTALNWTGGTMSLNLNPDIYAAIQRSGVPAHLDIDVPKGKEFILSTGVYDWHTGKAGTLETPLHPGAATPTLAKQ